MDKFLARSLGIAALLAGSGVFYHYVIHLPGTDRERVARYQRCMYAAHENYAKGWESACKTAHGDAEAPKDCPLPSKFADSVNQQHNDAKKQCEIDSKVGA